MNKEQIKHEAVAVFGDVAKGISFWVDGLYENEWQGLSDLVQKLKSLKEAGLRRQQSKLR